jgi:hypothetical protein
VKKRKTMPWLASLAAPAAVAAVAWACGDSDENTKPRTGTNGCIADSCYDVAPPVEGGDPGDGGSPPDGGSRLRLRRSPVRPRSRLAASGQHRYQ